MSRQNLARASVLILWLALPVQADIYRWDNGELIAGTEGITPGPGVDLDDWNSASHNIRFADFSGGIDLQGTSFYRSWLDNASLGSAKLTDANLSGANLTDAGLFASTLTGANLTGAVVVGANFFGTTVHGFTSEQLYSTASYQAKDLQGIGLRSNDLTGWDFSGQNLTNASLEYSRLTNANLSGANLTDAYLESSTLTNADLSGANLTDAYLEFTTLTDANLSGAVVTGAYLGRTTGLTQAQLASTASYQAKDLTGIGLRESDMTGWDLSGQNLTEAKLYAASLTDANLRGANLTDAYLRFGTLTDADLSGANLTNANLSSTTLTDANLSGATVAGVSFASMTGLTQTQLASTANYPANLQGIELERNDLSGWDFSGQNLTGASLEYSTLTDANLTGANLTNASLDYSTLTRANLTGANLTNASLDYSTLTRANLTGANLTDADLGNSTLTDANLTGANLTDAYLGNWTLTAANLSGANLKNASLDSSSLGLASLNSETTYNQWTVFGGGFDPVAAGLSFMESPVGDVDANDVLDVGDIDMLAAMLRGELAQWWLPETMFDVNTDVMVDEQDLVSWIHDLKHTWLGDANLDGLFESNDVIEVLAANTYETDVDAGWADGDFNASGRFDADDLMDALADNGYENGPRPMAVPEPAPAALWLVAIVGLVAFRRSRAVVQSCIRNTLCIAIASCLCLGPSVRGAAGSFEDDFSNPHPTNPDRQPVTWRRVFDDTFMAIENGTLIARADEGKLGIVASTSDFRARDVWVESQFRILKGFSGGVTARFEHEGRCYFGNVKSDAASIWRCGNPNQIITEWVPVDVDVTNEDAVMRLEIVGDQLKLWVWPPERTRPLDPLVQVSDSAFSGEASVGVFITPGSNYRDETDGLFRYVNAAAIPEPSTGVQSCFGLASILLWRRKKPPLDRLVL